MNRFLFTICFLIISVTVVAQSKETIRKQALIIGEATKDQNFSTVVKYTHPSVIKMMGGREAALKTIKAGTSKLAEQGISFESVAIGTPGQIFTAGNELHCLVSQTIIMNVPTGKLVSESYLLAVTKDDGLNWTFINISEQLNNSTITKLLPNFNQRLKLPVSTKPVFYQDK